MKKEMFSNSQIVFEGLESGKGWDSVQAHCNEDATFSIQAVDAITELPKVTECKTIRDYAAWMMRVVQMDPDGAFWEVRAACFDEERYASIFYGVYGGYTDYVYIFFFDQETDKINHLTKVWNDQWDANYTPTS